MPIDRGVDKEDVVHIHNGILLSHLKERNNGICSNMDRTRSYHAKWSLSDSEAAISYAIPYMWNLKKGHNELLCRIDTDSQTLKILWSPEETVWGLGERAWVMGWKSCETGLWWSLYNYRCDKCIE